MALVKIKDFDPRYAQILGSRDITRYSLYSDLTNEEIGKVKDILVDEDNGEFRYLIIDIGFWIFGKEVLLPIERAQFNFGKQRVYTKGLTKEQADNLPRFDESLRIDDAYEENLRKTYGSHPLNTTIAPLGNSAIPLVPFSPITIGALASLSYPNIAPTAGTGYVRTDRTNQTFIDPHNL
ncbi:PRC-barrel domain-containing protein [Leptolyngbya sp. GB1-A1]|uniref:PRC-barrel domain-containing protein n=1 Tax=Leptolyngbya sp. GB1-A1 TaxID=2933908 RepID=UPI003297BBDF